MTKLIRRLFGRVKPVWTVEADIELMEWKERLRERTLHLLSVCSGEIRVEDVEWAAWRARREMALEAQEQVENDRAA